MNKLQTKIFAYFDLLLGILLLLTLVFPEIFFNFIDARINFLFGFLFLLIIGGRGLGLGILIILFSIMEKAVKQFNKWYLTKLFDHIYRQFKIFIISYLEGTLLLVILLIITLPIFYPLITLLKGDSMAGWYIDDFPILEPVKEKFDQNLALFNGVVNGFIQTKNDESGAMIFATGILLTAFSFFSLYLIKSRNFSLGRMFVGARADAAAIERHHQKYDELLKIVRGEDE